MKIHIIDQAEDDLVEGYKFYEDQAPELGVYFWTVFTLMLSRLCCMPVFIG